MNIYVYPHVSIYICEFSRNFKLRLQSSPNDVFAPDVEVIEDDRKVWYDTTNVVHGFLKGE